MALGFFENQRQDSHRSTRPTLIIDDECDEATPNAGGQNRDDRAVTHQAVRNLIESHALVSYVGYSATPFANVLINREEEAIVTLVAVIV